jgi:hypothetical protein
VVAAGASVTAAVVVVAVHRSSSLYEMIDVQKQLLQYYTSKDVCMLCSNVQHDDTCMMLALHSCNQRNTAQYSKMASKTANDDYH